MSADGPKSNADSPSASKRARSPRSGRLLRHADFEIVYKQGRRHFALHLTVFYLRRDKSEGGSGELRVGFTVGRVLGGAVVRNRMKRRLREAVRLCRPTSVMPVDVVINPKKSLLTADFGDLEREITRAFQVIENSIANKQRPRTSDIKPANK
ncbi:MAG: ribonuclease P protein component [Acidobacteriota bacterium]|nr:ribonuclease P protein component [Acidobacteriota bacterium]